MLADFTLATFVDLVGTEFRVDFGGENELETTLVDARDLTHPSAPSSPERDPRHGNSFALHFRGLGQPLLPQGTYHFTHDALGTFPLFIVPIGRDRSGTTYEAIFNRLT